MNSNDVISEAEDIVLNVWQDGELIETIKNKAALGEGIVLIYHNEDMEIESLCMNADVSKYIYMLERAKRNLLDNDFTETDALNDNE